MKNLNLIALRQDLRCCVKSMAQNEIVLCILFRTLQVVAANKHFIISKYFWVMEKEIKRKILGKV